MHIKSLFRYFRSYSLNAGLVSAPQFISAFVGILTLPLVLNSIDIKDYGTLQFVMAVTRWLGAFSFVRISKEAKIGISRGENGTYLFATISRIALFTPVVILSVITSFILFSFGIDKTGMLFLLSVFNLIAAGIICQDIANFFIAHDNFFFFFISQTFFMVIPQIVSATAAYYTGNIVIMTGSKLTASICLGIIGLSFVFIRYEIWSSFLRKEYDKKLLIYGIKMLPTTLAVLTRQNLFSIIIKIFLGEESLAVFSIAYNAIYRRITEAVKKLTPLLYTKESVYSSISRKLKDSSFVKSIVLFCIAATILLILTSIIYIHVFVPDSYFKAKFYVAILIIPLPMLILTQLLMLSLTIRMDHRSLNFINIVRAVFELLIVAILGFLFGVSGICLGISSGVIIEFLLALYSFCKITREESK